jgi:hypothetical protein
MWQLVRSLDKLPSGKISRQPSRELTGPGETLVLAQAQLLLEGGEKRGVQDRPKSFIRLRLHNARELQS